MNGRLRVLYLIDTLEVGGAERSLLGIIQHLSNVDAHVCMLYPGDTLKQAYEAAGIPVTSLELVGKYGFLSAVRRVRALVRAWKPDVIHSTLSRASLVARIVSALERIPLLGSFVSMPYESQRGWKHKAVLLADRWTAPLADRFMAISAEAKRSNARALRVAPERVTVIPRGRDLNSFHTPSAFVLSRLRADLGIAPGAPVLVNVGRLRESKGQADALQAFPHILDACPEARLLIAGEGPYRGRLEAIIQELGLEGRADLLGYRADVRDLLALADLFIFPSYSEGQGSSLVEALASGTPIVASDIPVHYETLRPGQTGEVFPLGDIVQLATVVVALLQDEKRRAAFSEKARKDAEERFDIRHIAAQHSALYWDMASEGR